MREYDGDENWQSELSVSHPGSFEYRLYWEEEGAIKAGSVGHFSVPPKLVIKDQVSFGFNFDSALLTISACCFIRCILILIDG